MNASVIVGAQWGDEGKGKIVDLCAQDVDVVVRYAGGANAGHTLVVDGKKIVLHLIPSGILHPHTECLIGQGTVVDPEQLLLELSELESHGIATRSRLWLAKRAHVVLPYHKQVDAVREDRGRGIGTTKRGIGPCYEDKAGRRGIRVGDLLDRKGLESGIAASLAYWQRAYPSMQFHSTSELVASAVSIGERLHSYFVDGGPWLHSRRSKRLLFEGAQGVLLDVDHGTYPFVTSSSAAAGGACTGSGFGPAGISRVIGITKAYVTRVGEGPFPTELNDVFGELLRAKGHEYGATTGRPRRTGWLDLIALRHAVQVGGITELTITKLDVLSGLQEIQFCTAYELKGERLSSMPFSNLDAVRPIYDSMPGFMEDISSCKRYEELPSAAHAYLEMIEKFVECPICIVSVGPDREQTIFRE